MQLQTLMKISLSIVAFNRVFNSIVSLRVDRNDVIKSSTFNAQVSRRLVSITKSLTSKLSTQKKQKYRQQKKQRMTLQKRRQKQIKSTRSTQTRFAQRLKYWKQRCVWFTLARKNRKSQLNSLRRNYREENENVATIWRLTTTIEQIDDVFELFRLLIVANVVRQMSAKRIKRDKLSSSWKNVMSTSKDFVRDDWWHVDNTWSNVEVKISRASAK